MSAPTMTLAESGALRQLKHNDGSEGFVLAYDKAITDRYIAELRAALASQGVAVPAGWALVPVEPTHEMFAVARTSASGSSTEKLLMTSYWRGMLAASPRPPAMGAAHHAAVPAGYDMVPASPTQGMCNAARAWTDAPRSVYLAMIAAAPQPPAVKEAEQPSQRHDSRTAYESLDLKGRRRMDETLARVDQMIQDSLRRKHPDRRQHVAPVEVERRVADARGTGIHQDRKPD